MMQHTHQQVEGQVIAFKFIGVLQLLNIKPDSEVQKDINFPNCSKVII